MAKDVADKHYCDSCVFIAFLNQEPENFEKARNVLSAAESGYIELYTSTFTMAEVIYINDEHLGSQLTEEDKETIINSLFANEWIRLVGFDREAAEINRYLVRKYRLKPPDALQLASAIRLGADYFDTTDRPLIQNVSDISAGSVSYLPRYPKQVVVQEPLVAGWTPTLFDL